MLYNWLTSRQILRRSKYFHGYFTRSKSTEPGMSRCLISTTDSSRGNPLSSLIFLTFAVVKLFATIWYGYSKISQECNSKYLQGSQQQTAPKHRCAHLQETFSGPFLKINLCLFSYLTPCWENVKYRGPSQSKCVCVCAVPLFQVCPVLWKDSDKTPVLWLQYRLKQGRTPISVSAQATSVQRHVFWLTKCVSVCSVSTSALW